MKMPDISVIVDGSLLYEVNVTVREYISAINYTERKPAHSLFVTVFIVVVFKRTFGDTERRVQNSWRLVFFGFERIHGFLLKVRFFA